VERPSEGRYIKQRREKSEHRYKRSRSVYQRIEKNGEGFVMTQEDGNGNSS
jgi:hypothetical protein